MSLFKHAIDFDWQKVEELIDAGDFEPNEVGTIDGGERVSILTFAVNYCAYDVAKKLIKAGADVNARIENLQDPNTHLHTPLVAALYRGKENLPKERSEYKKLIKLLLANGAQIDSFKDGESSLTPLIAACRLEEHTAVTIFLDAGADVQIADCWGRNAFFNVGINETRDRRSRNTTLRKLIDAGINTSRLADDGTDVLFHGFQNEDYKFLEFCIAKGDVPLETELAEKYWSSYGANALDQLMTRYLGQKNYDFEVGDNYSYWLRHSFEKKVPDDGSYIAFERSFWCYLFRALTRSDSKYSDKALKDKLHHFLPFFFDEDYSKTTKYCSFCADYFWLGLRMAVEHPSELTRKYHSIVRLLAERMSWEYDSNLSYEARQVKNRTVEIVFDGEFSFPDHEKLEIVRLALEADESIIKSILKTLGDNQIGLVAGYQFISLETDVKAADEAKSELLNRYLKALEKSCSTQLENEKMSDSKTLKFTGKNSSVKINLY